MSEYQYYEFRAIDRPLDRSEMDQLRRLSTRAEITPSSFTNTYNWGDFKGDPDVLMGRYFDAFVYVANWGTNRLMFRIPRGLLDLEAASEYCDDETLRLTARKEHVVLEFLSEEEAGGDWVEGEHWMPSLISIRDELMRGDLRALYLGWLASIRWLGGDEEDECEEEDDVDRFEPPVPPGLSKLSGPLRELAEFLRVEDELIEVAAAESAGEPPAGPTRTELARWIKGLPASEKDAYLVRLLAEDGDLRLRAELARRFREATAPKKSPAPVAGRRTVAQLLKARNALVSEKARREAERKARERARREREQAEARARYLDGLAGREAETWREVEALIASKRPKEYDRAVALLVDLRDLAARSGRASAVEARIGELRAQHRNKPSFLKRLDAQALGG